MVRVRVENPPTHSEQGMYENSCINLSFPSAPGPQQGLEENDAREKLNPMSKIRQTQLLLSGPWSPGWGNGMTQRPGGLGREGWSTMGRGQARFGMAFLLP